MTDLHTHILPGMDDGSRSPEMSLEMLRAEAGQGIHTVALTPHYYRERESSGQFLERRGKAVEALEAAMASLPEEEQKSLPRLILGAEVAWVPNLAECSRLRELCYSGTSALLLELPMTPWYDGLFHQLYDLMNATGLTPVIAHIDRYWTIQKPERLRELMGMGLPVQLSAEALLRLPTKGRALKALRTDRTWLLISDCHSLRTRRPNLGEGLTLAERKLGSGIRADLEANADKLLRKYAVTA